MKKLRLYVTYTENGWALACTDKAYIAEHFDEKTPPGVGTNEAIFPVDIEVPDLPRTESAGEEE